jgi:GTP cyclohydrolase I
VTEKEKEVRLARLPRAVRTILECVGEDPDQEGLLDTPERSRNLGFVIKVPCDMCDSTIWSFWPIV